MGGERPGDCEPRFREPGASTAVGAIVAYRVGKLARRELVSGRWLDCGCADGGYTVALLDAGAQEAFGIDPSEKRIAAAIARAHPRATFSVGHAEGLAWDDGEFDGVLLNEVLEHVDDERATLAEIRRVLRPDGHLALFSPNRIFPFEGHGLRFGPTRSIGRLVPIVPWLPLPLTHRYLTARNYWPWRLRRLVEGAGFTVVHSSSAFPQFEIYPWLPAPLIPLYRRLVPVMERVPGLRWLGVSCFIVARPDGPEPRNPGRTSRAGMKHRALSSNRRRNRPGPEQR